MLVNAFEYRMICAYAFGDDDHWPEEAQQISAEGFATEHCEVQVCDTYIALSWAKMFEDADEILRPDAFEPTQILFARVMEEISKSEVKN